MTQLIPIVEKRLYTLDEFERLDFPFDDNIYELIDGAVVISPPAGDDHGRIINELSYELNAFVKPRKLGQVWQTSGFRVAPGFGPAPDVAYITAERLPKRQRGAVEIAPDLAVEVWSPGDLDTRKHQEEARRKIRRYQVAGVSLVWAVNPSNRTVEVFHPDQPDPVQILDDTGILSGEDVLPGFKLPVKSLFPLE